jgi:hypothetical protein
VRATGSASRTSQSPFDVMTRPTAVMEQRDIAVSRMTSDVPQAHCRSEGLAELVAGHWLVQEEPDIVLNLIERQRARRHTLRLDGMDGFPLRHAQRAYGMGGADRKGPTTARSRARIALPKHVTAGRRPPSCSRQRRTVSSSPHAQEQSQERGRSVAQNVPRARRPSRAVRLPQRPDVHASTGPT